MPASIANAINQNLHSSCFIEIYCLFIVGGAFSDFLSLCKYRRFARENIGNENVWCVSSDSVSLLCLYQFVFFKINILLGVDVRFESLNFNRFVYIVQRSAMCLVSVMLPRIFYLLMCNIIHRIRSFKANFYVKLDRIIWWPWTKNFRFHSKRNCNYDPQKDKLNYVFSDTVIL